jgi:anti-sigma-K factor RskA
MNYDSPELREQLAAEYVLGTMPPLVRRRFERLLATDPELAREVEDWRTRFGPIDYAAAAQEPPERVWLAVERRLALGSAPVMQQAAARQGVTRQGWLGSLAFWRIATLTAAAVAAVAIFYLTALTPSSPPSVVAILSDDKGDPGWIALRGAGRNEIAVAPIRAVAGDSGHAFELWAIAGGTPHPLGLLASEPGHPLMVQAALLPADGALAISVEPPGGSPTGLPTGPVRYTGKLLPREP